MSYAVTAIIVALIVKGGDQAICRALILVGGFHVTVICLMTALIVYFSLFGSEHFPRGHGRCRLLYRDGTWMERIQIRLANFLLLRAEAIFVIPMNVFLFLTGVRLMRSGAFSG